MNKLPNDLLIITSSLKDSILIKSIIPEATVITIHNISKFRSIKLPKDCKDAHDVVIKYGTANLKTLLLTE
jgi:hypothetical protein|tara:strand:+ start:483 stop:695 length:213 start_codon:yes stop_codon:yes gene_type:complete